MRFVSYFNTALLIIQSYDGSIPLSSYLRQYFLQHKKHGSKDRKYISHLCYCYYRLGHALKDIPVERRLKATLFLCSADISEWGILFEGPWLNNHSFLLSDRVAFIKTVYQSFIPSQIFPWQSMLSEGIDADAFALSHLVQPDLFLRARPGNIDAVTRKLQQHSIPYKLPAANTIALPNAVKADTIIDLNKEAVVQDYSSQQIQYFFSILQHKPKSALTVWDCCAASGGKSILAYDNIDNIQLTVSDVRPSIIHNLQQRFADAGITKYKSFVADLTMPSTATSSSQYGLVICDAPCSGSGTWSRTPEQLYFFTQEKIAYYSALQQKIVSRVISQLQKDGYLLYITCSVFRQENEDMVNLVKQQYGLALVEQCLLAGYTHKADTMFAALFINQGAA
ncbi:MAG TPA: hypothetical protein VG738_17665 [Chitinophagaceae bacterium]|nr:hypothetical protein [Chitinophagaceae bacterium]